MSGINDILGQIPMKDLAAKLGVDEATARQAAEQALPALLGGMQANASTGGAASLEKAVASHNSDLVTGGVNLDDVDDADGSKIVSNVFGDATPQVASALGTSGGGLGDVISKALPVLAPIVMSYLAGQFSKGSTTSTTATSGGGIGDLLGGLLGGGSGSSGGGLGDLLGSLGGLFGGGRK
ncbi:MAG: DUF937 domain-containing protein [Mycetocola sp.]